jgi:pimeloyl-ACP methyl ester carboxylesterase
MRSELTPAVSREVDKPGGERASVRSRWLAPALIGATALAAATVITRKRARKAEDKHPPTGRFLEADGVRLHYIERGRGAPVVLIHGNGSLIQDFVISGLVDRLSPSHRVIVIDRPGYGYSARPRRLWTARAYARLFRSALEQLGVRQAVVLGHSWGALVAAALALEAPTLVRGLILASGYYYPTPRADLLLFSAPAIPIVGDAMRYTVAPSIARAIIPGLIRRIFDPAPVPGRFQREFPVELTLRPSHLRASAEDTAMMLPSVMDLMRHYRDLALPVSIVTGADDHLVDPGHHSLRLHRELPKSRFTSLPGIGHMVHHMAPDVVSDLVDQISRIETEA